MDEKYFRQVVCNINRICREMKSRETKLLNESTVSSVVDLASVEEFEDRELYEYLSTLDAISLSTICALMDFGRYHGGKTINVNLNDEFTKLYLNEWGEKVQDGFISEWANYLDEKSSVLPSYLNRAVELLFNNYQDNGDDCRHSCGEKLFIHDVDAIDDNEYRIYFKCLGCGAMKEKVVDKNWIDERLI